LFPQESESDIIVEDKSFFMVLLLGGKGKRYWHRLVLIIDNYLQVEEVVDTFMPQHAPRLFDALARTIVYK